jgi:hypothetical protein
MRFQSLFLILFVLFASAATNQALNIRDLNISDPFVIDIAKFAVTEHNKQVIEAKLKFEKLVGGLASDVNDEVHYIFNISANNGSTSNNYVSFVGEKPPNHFYLAFFHILPKLNY